jgi:mono/diheme cytochrome c family protein
MLFAAGCRQDMHNQPKFYPQRGTSLFVDGRSARPQVAQTVARNQLHESSYFYTGFQNGKEGDGMPFPVTMQVLERGQERYNVYCTPCHSRVGNGVGMIVQRGYSQAGNLHSQRLQEAPLGHFYNVIANGYGAMPDYSAQIAPADRWAVTAYIRALQLSQNAKRADVPNGAHVEALSEIAEKEGLPPGFAKVWELPPTATPATALPAGAIPGPPGAGIPAPTQNTAPAATPTTTMPLPVTPPAAKTNATAAGSAKLAPAGFIKPATGAQAPAGAGAPAAGSAAAGHELYTKNCQMCHQPTMTGMPPAIPSLIGVVGKVGADRIHSIVHNGNPPMPAFPNLTPADIDNIIAYLSTNTKGAPKPSALPQGASAPTTKIASNSR